MTETSKNYTAPTRLDTIVKVIGIIGTFVTMAGTIVGIYIQLRNAQTNTIPAPDAASAVVSEAPVIYRGLEEFEDDDARLAYAADLLGKGQHQAAEAFLSDFLATVEPNSYIATAICYDRGLARLYLEEYNQAVSDFSAVTEQVEYPDAYYNLGNALLGLENFEKALEAYEHALSLEQRPEYINARDVVQSQLS